MRPRSCRAAAGEAAACKLPMHAISATCEGPPPPARRASSRSAPHKPSPPEGIRRAPHNDPVASTSPNALGAWAHHARAVGTWKHESNGKEAPCPSGGRVRAPYARLAHSLRARATIHPSSAPSRAQTKAMRRRARGGCPANQPQARTASTADSPLGGPRAHTRVGGALSA